MSAARRPEALVPGRLETVAEGVRRLVAPNPGPLTGPGTNTYLVGRERVVVLDPGPADPAHVAAIVGGVAAVPGARVEAIVVTHTHRDHSPAAAPLRQLLGTRLVGRLPRHLHFHDASFVPDEIPDDGAILHTDAGELVLVGTPGHASNHVCAWLAGPRLLFTGDHVLGTVSPVILVPDGDMAEYLESLARLQRLDLAAILPGHGPRLERPYDVLAGLVRHRLARERRIEEALAALAGPGPGAPARLEALLPRVYADVDPALHALARHSLEAHLVKLERDGRARRVGDGWQAA